MVIYQFLKPLLITLNLTLVYSLLFAFIDLYFIKWYRNLTKKDKRITIFLKGFFVVITSFNVIIREPYLIPTLVFSIWLTFDSLMGLFMYNNIFKVGKNAILDDFGDMLDGKDDEQAKLYWFFRLGLVIMSIILYYSF